MKKKEIEKIIGEAIGEGSMCWRERSKGIFDSENASRIVEETVNKIINIMKSKKDKQICRSRQGEKYRQMWEELYAEYGMCPIRKNDDEGYMSNILYKILEDLEQKYFDKKQIRHVDKFRVKPKSK